MKKTLLLLFMLLTEQLASQGLNKNDYIWVLGYPPNNPIQNSGGSLIDFNISPPKISYFNIPVSLTGVGLMCNPTGGLIFYTNGCSVINNQHTQMANGDGINSGAIADYYCTQSGSGYPTSMGIMALPFPQDTSNYLLLHFWSDFSTLNKRLQYTQINIAQNNGLGAVTQKNEIAFQDTFTNHLTAVRHGNGRDWWIATHKGRSNRSLFFLLDPEGIHPPVIQQIGPVWGPRDWSGQSVFSPDGSRYARANPDNGLNLFDFDRCTGTLSNPIVVSLAADSASATGVAFSPNSRFLYLSTGKKLYQFDMQAVNVPASKQIIGVYDGFTGPFATTFYQMRLAPNGEIYIAATNGVRYLHTIHQPDMLGVACNFIQHDLETPSHFYWALPNFPNFRLYDLPASPCDTLGINGGPWWTSTGEVPGMQQAVTVAPNPASDAVELRFQESFSGIVAVQDAAGRALKTQRADIGGAGALRLSVADLPNGLYCLRLNADRGGVPVILKVVVSR